VAARLASRSPSIALERGAVWGSASVADAALLSVEEGFLLVSADIGNGSREGDHHGAESRRIILATGQPETLLVPPAPGERLEALTACQISIISPDSLKVLLGLPSAAELITDSLAEALSERHATIRNCAYVRHSERVREKLLQLARTNGHVIPGGIRIDFPLTHQLLADMVGSARETVSLALSELAREGFLRRQRRGYILKIETHELLSAHAWSDVEPPAASTPRSTTARPSTTTACKPRSAPSATPSTTPPRRASSTASRPS
jgi:hypothetical protein